MWIIFWKNCKNRKEHLAGHCMMGILSCMEYNTYKIYKNKVFRGYIERKRIGTACQTDGHWDGSIAASSFLTADGDKGNMAEHQIIHEQQACVQPGRVIPSAIHQRTEGAAWRAIHD